MFKFKEESATGLGIHFKQGTLYRELMKLPKPKERYKRSWKGEHGSERDKISPTVYETAVYNPVCYLEADTLEELQQRRSTFLELISDPEGFDLVSLTLGKTFHLYYIDSPAFNTLTPIWTGGKLYCEFSLTLENDFEETINVFELADEEALIFTESGEQIYVEGYERNF